MTVQEYNKEFYPKITCAKCFVKKIEHAIKKTDHPEETSRQFRCIGWSEECRETILKALECYQSKQRMSIVDPR